MNITEFLEARITEDEAAEARKFSVRYDLLYRYQIGSDGYVELETRNGMKYERLSAQEFWAKYGEPAPDHRALAECTAKRAIAALHRVAADHCDEHNAMFEAIPCPTIRALAAVYKDHPDYQREWR